MRLAAATLDRAAPGAERFGYDRAAQAIGIVHIGIGAFHRAHQAWYTDRAMDAGDRDWAIAGVSLRSATVAGQLNPQDGLYTVAERSADTTRLRVVGAVREVVVATPGDDRAAGLIVAPETRIVSFTITEKGYARRADGSLDGQAADAGGSVYPLLHAGLKRRRDAGLPGLTLLSCDNLADNGRQLERLLLAYLDVHDAALAGWVAGECAFPSTMVDRIVPATTPADLDAVEQQLGLRDEGAVLTEPFSQWVIEDRFAGRRPRWDAVGAQLVTDVVPYETAKLRMLNGAHSALAYLGLERGHTFVHEAIADPALRALVEQLMRGEAATSFPPAPGQDLAAYAEALLARFANPALQHRLAQIAMDGSQKIPNRWLPVLSYHRERGTRCPAILAALGAWVRHVRGDHGKVDDPQATALQAAWLGTDMTGATRSLFAPGGAMSGVWSPDGEDIALMPGSPEKRPLSG
ncbi:MAG: mannitol dehydrogenase family protein [Novosphingobium sp.]